MLNDGEGYYRIQLEVKKSYNRRVKKVMLSVQCRSDDQSIKLLGRRADVRNVWRPSLTQSLSFFYSSVLFLDTQLLAEKSFPAKRPTMLIASLCLPNSWYKVGQIFCCFVLYYTLTHCSTVKGFLFTYRMKVSAVIWTGKNNFKVSYCFLILILVYYYVLNCLFVFAFNL